jgi:peptide deformylase
METPTTGEQTLGEQYGVLQLGDSRLRWPSKEIENTRAPEVRRAVALLHETLALCQAETGFGRAIAGPQVGRRLRLVSYDLGEGLRAMINPRIADRSRETFTLWDDCFSFPNLLVRVRRAKSVSIEFLDQSGHPQRWNDLEPPEAELFQHEIDHLHGVLALDRAVDPEAVVTREEFERERERLEALVDR